MRRKFLGKLLSTAGGMSATAGGGPTTSMIVEHARRIEQPDPTPNIELPQHFTIDEAITAVLSLLPRREANSGGEDQGEGQEKVCQFCFADP